MKKLVIVESPAKCEKIEKYLGDNYTVMGSYGHITHLSDLKQIDENYNPTFKIIDSKKTQIEKIRKAIKISDEVILATDDDREGEAIAWHICDVFKLNIKTTKRIIFHEITKKALLEAVENPNILNMDLIYAQQGRQILDLIVGYKITPILWKHIVSNTTNSLSAGRCQTPALRLVYENYKEIKENPGNLSFNTNGYFTKNNIQFNLNYNHTNHKDIKDFLEKSKTFKHMLSKEKAKESKKNPPVPFTTSILQQTSNTNLHISPKETMNLAQKLYESGYITYMRTDSMIYSDEFITSAYEYITNTYDKKFISGIISNKKTKKNKIIQEAHEAIRPTNINLLNIPDTKEFTNKHRKLYKLIHTNTLESLMLPAIYKQIIVKITAPNDLIYKYITEINIFEGWQIIQGVNDDKYYQFIINLTENELKPNSIISKETLKDLKTHYTEAKLVQLLEEKGIGRPSTFSSLIDKIQERGYVKKENINGFKRETIDYILEDNKITEEKKEKEFGNEKNKLVITQIGILVCEFLLTNFKDLFEYDYTKKMENELDLIAHGKMNYKDLCVNCDNLISELIKNNNLKNINSKKDEKLNIKIDDKHTYLIGKHGPIIKYIKEDESMGFYNVKENIDLDKLKKGEYKLEEIIKENEENKCIGEYKNNLIYLKYGKFGYYLECGELRKSLNNIKINVPLKKICLDDAISILEEKEKTDNLLIRKINDNLSIRTGKYGDYIFYKTNKMKKPQFLKLNDFDNNYKTCSLEYLKKWISDKYEI